MAVVDRISCPCLVRRAVPDLEPDLVPILEPLWVPPNQNMIGGTKFGSKFGTHFGPQKWNPFSAIGQIKIRSPANSCLRYQVVLFLVWVAYLISVGYSMAEATLINIDETPIPYQFGGIAHQVCGTGFAQHGL